MSERITAAEATEILRDLARGREDGNGADVWPLYDRAEDAMAAVVALDDELATAQSHATHALDDAATQRTRADAAEAECARLRAIVEGREHPPTPQEIAAHHDASGSGWLVSSDRDVIPYTLCRSEARDGGAPDGARWWPLDASGRPCPWPTPALAAAEGRS